MKLKPYDPDSELNIHLDGKARVSRPGGHNAGWASAHTARRVVPQPTLYSQQSVVVIEFVTAGAMRSGRSTRLVEHTKYLQEEQEKNRERGTVLEESEGMMRDGSMRDRSVLFDAEHDRLRTHRDIAEERGRLDPSKVEQRKALEKEMDRTPEVRWMGERHHFRIIVSPQNGRHMDMKQHIRSLMSDMEKDQGTKLQWYAAIHKDTEHVHAQIVLRGKRADGKNLFMDRAYISQGIRHRSQELATRELGPRSRTPDVIQQERMLEKERKEQILAHVQEQHQIREKVKATGPEISR